MNDVRFALRQLRRRPGFTLATAFFAAAVALAAWVPARRAARIDPIEALRHE